MIPALLLLGLAVPVAEAERAFAAMAQTHGQWTAFRAHAAPDAIMFTPDKVNVHEALKDAAEPQRPVMWWPRRTLTACDGTLAMSTGPWLRDGGRASGTFTTIWRRQPDGAWRWQLDLGRDTPKPVASGEVKAGRAACANRVAARRFAGGNAPAAADLSVSWDGRMPEEGAAAIPAVPFGETLAAGASDDGTLRWEVAALPALGPRALATRVWRWDGQRHLLALYDISNLPAPGVAG